MQFVKVNNQSREIQSICAQKCGSFFCRLRGLMFRRSLAPGEGLFMIQPAASRMDAAIHMLFMRFDLAVVWLDDALRVVDVQYCKRWRPAYIPSGAAKYVLELHAARLNDFQPGDQITVDLC